MASENNRKGFIGIHLGAGVYSKNKYDVYKGLLDVACRKTIKYLNEGGSALKAVSIATAILEDSKIINAGAGSNLTWNGIVECDAGIMDGEKLNFGAVGSVTQIKNPIKAAYKICKESHTLDFGRIRPSILVGQGALDFAKEHNIETICNQEMISPKSRKRHLKSKEKVLDYKRKCLRVQVLERNLVKGKQEVEEKKERKFNEDHYDKKCVTPGGVTIYVEKKCHICKCLRKETPENIEEKKERKFNEDHYEKKCVTPGGVTIYVEKKSEEKNERKFNEENNDKKCVVTPRGVKIIVGKKSMENSSIKENQTKPSGENDEYVGDHSVENSKKDCLSQIKEKIQDQNSGEIIKTKSLKPDKYIDHNNEGNVSSYEVDGITQEIQEDHQEVLGKRVKDNILILKEHDYLRATVVAPNIQKVIQEIEDPMGQNITEVKEEIEAPMEQNITEVKEEIEDPMEQNITEVKEEIEDPMEHNITEVKKEIEDPMEPNITEVKKEIEDPMEQNITEVKKEIEDEEEFLDTVGAVCVDLKGNVASSCSSGGIILKRSGRLGQACTYGCGCWAMNSNGTKPGIAVSTSGVGEFLIRTSLAKEVATCLTNTPKDDETLPSVVLNQCLHDHFLESVFLKNVEFTKLGGVLALMVSPEDSCPEELLWAHTSSSMFIGSMGTQDKKPKVRLSEMPKDKIPGQSVVVESTPC